MDKLVNGGPIPHVAAKGIIEHDAGDAVARRWFIELQVEIATFVFAGIQVQLGNRSMVILAISKEAVEVSFPHFVQQTRLTLSRPGFAVNVKHLDHIRVVGVFVPGPADQFNHAVDRQVGDQRIDHLNEPHLVAKPGPRRDVDLSRCRHPILNHIQGIEADGQRVASKRPPAGVVGTGNVYERLGALDLAGPPVALGCLIVRPELLARDFTDRNVVAGGRIEHLLGSRAATVAPGIKPPP